ncbi:MAG: hypothetical protein ACK5V0_13945 [Alphaproteobacteria bacterium]|jgi:hypothetical protein|nr:hypothetical protein [Rhizobiaceae bacterium]
MKFQRLAAASLVLASFHASAAPEKGLRVSMQVERDGQTLAKPSIWQPSGTAGEISLQNEFRLKVTPTLTEDKADVRFEIFTTQNGVETKQGAPRIITKVGEQASLAWSGPSGQSYRLSVLVSESEKPAK